MRHHDTLRPRPTDEPGLVEHEPHWGHLDGGTAVGRWVLDDGVVRVGLCEHGARIQSVLAPDAAGTRADVVLGFDDVAVYAGSGRSFGATVGRFANRIGGGSFTLEGREFHVPPTDRGNALHGGPQPFSQRLWSAHRVEGRCGVRFSLFSPDGDNGFPGAVSVHVTYLLAGGVLSVETQATTDAPTVVNLTNHAYWNLAGEGTTTAAGHLLEVAAETFLPVDETGLPTGELRAVAGTPFDLRTPTVVGDRVGVPSEDTVELDEQLVRGKGFDHCFVLADVPGGRREAELAARLTDPGSGRTLEVWTDQPGVQVFTGGSLAGTLRGKAGTAYGPLAGIALEAQGLPDAPNRPEFPSTALLPGEEFGTVTRFRFGVR